MKQKFTQYLVVFLICLLTINCKSSGCSAKVEQLQLFASRNEKLQINLHDNLFEGEDLVYDLQDTKFKIINPIANTGMSSSHKTSASIRAAKPYHTKKMQSWLNSFVFLDQNDVEVSIFFSEGNALDKIPTPDFKTKVKIATVADSLQCYDVDYIDNDKFIIDCQKEVIDKEQIKQIDVFYIYSKNLNQVTSFDDEASAKIYNKRLIGLYYTTSALGTETTYIVRITPTYSLNPTEQLSGNSFVQVYKLSENYQILPRNYILDNVTMAFLLGRTDVELSIVDFEISYNGFIFLLDAQYGLFVVRLLPSGRWELVANADFQIGQLFAFDIDYEHKKDGSELGVVAVLGYNFFAILDEEKSYIHELPFLQLDYPATIKISQDNIIVRDDKQAYFYKINVDTDTIYLNSRIDIPVNDVLLVNGQEPDFIQISSQNSQRYTISNGYLYYSGSDKVQEQKLVTIKATAPNKQECTIQLFYQIVEDNDNKIYQFFNQPMPFPDTIAEGQTQSIMKKLASGPNLQYKLNQPVQMGTTEITGTFESRVELKLNHDQPINVVYAEIISTEDHTQFYQALQSQNLQFQIMSCVHDSIYSESTFCEVYVTDLGIKNKATKQNFSIWSKNDIIYFMYVDAEYSVVIKQIKNGKISPIKTIQLDSNDTANKIQRILNCGDYLLVHTANNNILTYLTYRPELFVLTTLNKGSFSQYGYDEDWEPTALFNNKKIHPNMIFILHKNHILILDTDYGVFSFIKKIDIIPNLEYTIAIGQETFFVVQGKTTGKAAQIYEYNFADINNVYLQKSLYLYWYDISSPLNADFSEETGHLFIRGVCLYCSKSFILIFKPNTPQHEALVQAWNISNQLIPDENPILIAANGFHQTYLYLNVQEAQQIYAIYDQTIMIVDSIIRQELYQEKYTLNFQIYNYDFVGKPEEFNVIDINQQVTTIYSLTEIKLDQNEFPFSQSSVQILSTDDLVSVSLDDNWYSGQIGIFEVDCDQCETNIEIQSTIDLVNPKIFNDYVIRDYVKYDTKFQLMQATTGLLFLNYADDSLAAAYDFDLPDFDYYCYQATVSEDKMIIYSLCNDGQEYTVYATGCLSITGCSPLGEKFKLGKASKIQVVQNELLVVLHTDSSNPELVEDGQIVLYRIVMGLQDWRLEVIEVIDLNFLNQKLGNSLKDFRPTEFSVVRQKDLQFNKYTYKLFISDSVSGFIFIDFLYQDRPEYQFLQIETLNLHDYLNKDVGQYTLSTTKFLSFHFIKEPMFEWSSNHLKANLIVLTSDASQYGIKFVFASQPELNTTVISSKELSAVLVRYGDWTPINKLAIQYTYSSVAIPYRKQNQIIVVVYKLNLAVSNHQSTVAPSVSIGSYRVFYEQNQEVNPLNLPIFYSNKNPILFVAQLQGPLQSYGINESPTLIVSNLDKTLKNQEITLIAKNDFYQAELKFNLNIKEVDNHECIAKIINVQIYPSTGELLQWNLSQNIFEGVSLKYEILDNDDFAITQPTSQIGESQQHIISAIEIVSAKATLTKNRAWSNQFAFLNKNENLYSIYYTDTPIINNAPKFTKFLQIQKTDENLVCLDFVQLFADLFVVDCQILNNKFLLIITSNKETETSLIANTQLHRVLDTYQFNNFQYLIRVTLSITNEGLLADDSYVELFYYLSGYLVELQQLDKTKLSQISELQINQLNIVDFKIGLNGDIYLLDAKLGIFVVNYYNEWKFQRLIKFKFGQAYSFDRILLQNDKEAFVVQGYNYYTIINSEGQTLKVQDLQFNSIAYPQSIKGSSNYIFVQTKNTLFIYHSDEQNSGLIDNIHLENEFAVVNPFIQELVTISLTESARWNISLGTLRFNGIDQSTQTFQDLIIAATSQHNLRCSTTIQYKVIESSSQALIKKTKSDKPFPQVFDEIFEQFQLGNLISGPNLDYTLSLPKTPMDFTAQIEQHRQIEVTNWPKNPLFSTELVGNDRETLFQVFQTADKKLTIQRCVLTNHVKYVCEGYGTIQLQEKITEQLFSIWQDSDNVVRFITIQSLYKVTAYSVPDGIVNEGKSITFTQQDDLQILNILYQGDYLFILQKNGQLSCYLSEIFRFVNSVIGIQLIGFEAQWKPLRIYGNRILKPNIIFIQNENNIAIINYINSEFIYTSSIEYTKDNQIYISNAKNTFFLVNNKEIYEYNYENLLNIYKSKTVELFGYTIVNPLVVTSQLSTGNLVIKTIKGQNIYLNIYRSSQPQHDTFYLAFQLNGIKQEDQFQLSLGGSLYIITFANGDKIQQLNFILLNPELIVIPNKKAQKFVSNFFIALDIQNREDNKQQVHFEQNVKVANTQTNLIVNDEDYLKSIEINETDQQKEVAIQSNWIGGQLIHTELTLEAINDDIILLPFVSQEEGVLMDYKIFDAAKPFDVTYLQALNTVLAFKGNDLKNAQPVLTKLSDQYKCFRLEADITRLYSLCNNGVEDQIQVASCDDKGCKRENAYISSPYSIQIVALAQDVVVILHTDSLNPENYDGYITIQKLVSNDGIWSSQLLFTIDYQFIQSKMGAQAPKLFRPSSFVHSPTGNSISDYYLQLIITDSVNGLLFVDLILSKNSSEVKYQFLEYQLLKDWLNIDQYATDATNYYQAQLISAQVAYPTKKTLKLLVVTDISSSYIFELVFDINANKSCKLSSIRTIVTLNRYGNFKALNYVSASQSSVAIPYVNNLEVIIGLYRIPTDQENSGVQVIQGSITFAFFNQFISPLDFLLFNSDNSLLTSTSLRGVQQNYVRDQQILKFGNAKQLHNQQLQLSFENDFRRITRTIILSIISVDQNECQTKLTDLKIYPSQGETKQWSLTQNLFDGVSLKYSIDQTDFSIEQPLSQYGEQKTHKIAAKQIVAAKATLTKNRAWSNKFAFLNNDDFKYSIFYTENAILNDAPSFSQVFNITEAAQQYKCFDFVQLAASTFAVECQRLTNKVLILANENDSYEYIQYENALFNRLLGTYQIKNEVYVVRVTLSITFDGKLANTSFLDLYKLSEKGLDYKTTLDKSTLSQIVLKQIDQLNIVDYKIGLNGYIYLLDAKLGIFVVYFDTEWKFVNFIEFKLGQTFAFDRTVLDNNQEIFVIKGYNFYGVINKQGKVLKIQDLSFTSVTYPQNIRLSQKYVFLDHQEKLYIYHSDDNNSNLIDIINLKNSAAIINPNSQQFVTVSLTQASAWAISLGSLKFNEKALVSADFKTLNITAQSQHNQICYSIIYYKVLASNTETIIKKVETESPFPNVLGENEDQIKLGSLVSGPNLFYEIAQPKQQHSWKSNQFLRVSAEADLDVISMIAHQRTIQVTNWAKNSIYQTSLVANNQETLFQVFQQEDKKIIIQTCELIDHVKYECKDFANLQIQEQLSDQRFSIWQDEDNIVHFITIDTLFIIKFFQIKNSQTIQYGLIKLIDNEEKDELKLVAFQNQGDTLFVIQENGELSSYSTNKFTLTNQITGANLIGFQGDWKPIKLYGNRILRKNVIIVQNENNLAIISFSNQEFIYGSKIDYTKNNEIYISQSQNSFFFVNNKEIYEYNYENLNKVFKQKTVELYGYQIAIPLGVSSHLQSGNLIIRTTKNDAVFLNIFKPDQLQHETFYLAVKINNAKIDDTFSVSSGGSDLIGSAYILTLVNGQVIQQLDFIVLDPELIVIPNRQKQKYLTDYEISINVKSASSQNNNQLEFSQKVKVINTFTTLIVDNTKATQQIDIEAKQNSTSVKLTNGWINGQLSQCTLKQEKTNDIVLQPYLYQTKNEVIQNHQFRDASTFQKNVVFQAVDTVFLMKDNKLEDSKALFDLLSSEYNCYRIASYDMSIYSLCNNGVEDQIQVASCDDKGCKRENTYISSPYSTQIVALAQNVVAILHTDSLNPENYDGYITIQKLVSNDGIWSSQLLFTIDYQFIQSKMGAQAPKLFRPSSFVYSLTNTDENPFSVQFIISDSVNGLVFVDLSISKNTFETKYIFMEYLFLNKWLNENKQYANDNTHYYSNKIIEESIKEKTKTVILVVITDNSSSYVFNLQFAIQDNYSNKLTKTQVQVALNRYGTWRALNTVAADKKTVVVAFMHNSKVVVGVYPISENAVSVMNGSFSFTIAETSKMEPRDLLLYLQDYTLISSKFSKGLNQYEIGQDVTLKFGESAKLENQTLTLTFSNDFRSVSKEIKLSIKPDNGGDDNGGSSSKAWWIILIVVASLIVIGLVGFFFYKKKEDEEEEEKEKLEDQDANYVPVN